MAKIRVTWNGSSREVHPVLGELVPGTTIEVDVDADLVKALEADTSGLFTIETERRPRRAQGEA